jgi:DNA-binding IscR family transcriptional regulator/DNA-binding XRE family transcriptional regulator
VSRQAVYSLIRYAALPVPRGVLCSACDTLIPTPAACPQDCPGALCLRCLEQLPGATSGQRLRAYRLAAGLSRAEAAWMAGVSRATVQRAELGQRPKNPESPGRLARVLGLPEAPPACVVGLSAVALRSLRVLRALASAGGRGVVGTRLAERCGIDRTTALRLLRAGGLVAAARKGRFGYRLPRPAKDIRLLDVVEAVGGSVRLELAPVPVLDGDELHRRLQAACDDAAEAGRAVLRAVSLAELLDGEGF